MPSLLPDVRGFYDPRTFSLQYVVACPATRRCAIVDPVLDFDEKSGSTATTSDAILAYVRTERLEIEWILDTHPHADHLSAADYLKRDTGAPTAIGARIVEVQALWRDIYGWPELACDGSQWDRLFADGDTFRIGAMEAHVMHSPGHTLASITYVVGDAAFVHDTLFPPDSGTARCDFPGGDAGRLYDSIQAILALPDGTRLYTGHDYRPGGRDLAFESTVAEQAAKNIHFASRPSRERFVELRQARDRSLPMPRLILHALQINLQAGRLPAPDAEGRRWLRVPLDAFAEARWD